MKIASAVLLISLFFTSGCRTTMLGPVPSRPEHTISVTIDSIPSGADVYAIENDGQLGAKIGTTPFVHECGVAGRYHVWTDTKEQRYRETILGWGAGTKVEYLKDQWMPSLTLNIALAKGEHSVAVASKIIVSGRRKLEDKSVFLTVPLKTLAQVNKEMELHLQQQALSGQQNINIQQQKDGLDSINGGLDALIKLNGLGAFR